MAHCLRCITLSTIGAGVPGMEDASMLFRSSSPLTGRGLRVSLPAVFITGVFVMFFVAGSTAAGKSVTPAPKRLVIAGTGSCIGPMQRIAEAFQKKQPPITFGFLPNIGGMESMRAVMEERIDIGLSPRPLTPEERGTGVIETPYGRTPLIFAVQESNPTSGLTLAGIEEIYLRKQRIWPDGTPVRHILRPLRDSFSIYLASINPRLQSAYREAHTIPGVFVGMTDQEAVEQIEKTPGSFGITSSSFMTLEKRKIKALSVDGVAPAPSNIPDGVDISAGKYPYAMTISLLYKGNSDNVAVRDFVEFVFSKDGKKILLESSHMTLPRTTGR